VTPTDVALVQRSFHQIVPIGEQAAALFLARLFELDPALRTMFGGNIQEQGRQLIASLATAVASLEQTEVAVQAIREYGAQLGGYGVIEEHYASVGAALLWTLQKGLGPEFTPAVCAAWTNIYTRLAKIMIEAQRGAPVAA
jgi:nitric oxide dioxygenase